MLRDLIRQISEGNSWIPGLAVGGVDERSEIGGCYMGVAQNHLGIRTDILDGCPKAEGMIMLIRSMGPQVIAVDEIGTPEDVNKNKGEWTNGRIKKETVVQPDDRRGKI